VGARRVLTPPSFFLFINTNVQAHRYKQTKVD